MIVWQTYHPTGERNLVVRVGAGTGHFHDGIGRLAVFGQDFAGPLQDLSWTLARNPASQIVSDYRSADVAWTGHYAVNRAYATDGLNRYSTAGGASFAYDLNGNLTSDGARTYTYDVENRLVGASGGLTLAYDPLGRLHQTSGGASGTTRFLYDGDALVGEYDAAGNLARRYAHGPGADEPWLWYEGAQVSPATRRQLAADPQGSIAAIADGAGNRLAVNRYDEYGIPAATNMGRFQYTGQIWLPDLGMYHYKARIYSPTLGRFMQTDPIGYDDQFNLYAYVGNDPVNGSDPTGTFRVVYRGPEAGRLRAVAEQAAGSHPELSRRYQVLQQSSYVHDVYAVQPIFPKPMSEPIGDNANENAQNGIGTGSRVVISLEPIPLPGQGIGGDDITASPGAQVAHELLSHSYDSDQGSAADPSLPISENTAIGVENIYRGANGEEQRVRHSREEPW